MAIVCLCPAGFATGVQTESASQSAVSAPYTEEEVEYDNPNAPGVTLAGTLTIPRGEKASPAVLLISGAGPHTRDEESAGHKVFAVLADYLARKGLVVLRTDDRGISKSTGNFAAATTKDFASDAEAGVRFLMTRSEVDRKHIGLMGHGEGAIVAAMAAARMPEISYIVLLSGTAMPGEQVLLTQTARAETAAGLPEDQVAADYAIGRRLYAMVRMGRSESAMQSELAGVPPQYEVSAAAWRKQIPKLQTPWLRFFLSYDPATALAEVKCPVLAVWGSKDVTVDPNANAEAMKAALSKAHNHDVAIKVLPGLNYLLQKADTGLAYEYGEIKETISPTALTLIGDWFAKRVF